MTMQAILGYLRILAFFALLWGGYWVWNNVGCRRVEGAEMQPAVKKDTSPFITSGVRASDLKRDDIVFYTILQGTKTKTVVGRVIGEPGDRVRIEKGDVLINGTKIDSNYVAQDQRLPTDALAEMLVPRDHVFILSDGRKMGLNSRIDSRTLGPIGQWAIAGKIK